MTKRHPNPWAVLVGGIQPRGNLPPPLGRDFAEQQGPLGGLWHTGVAKIIGTIRQTNRQMPLKINC
jgi:hypothetical protein